MAVSSATSSCSTSCMPALKLGEAADEAAGISVAPAAVCLADDGAVLPLANRPQAALDLRGVIHGGLQGEGQGGNGASSGALWMPGLPPLP